MFLCKACLDAGITPIGKSEMELFACVPDSVSIFFPLFLGEKAGLSVKNALSSSSVTSIGKSPRGSTQLVDIERLLSMLRAALDVSSLDGESDPPADRADSSLESDPDEAI